MSEEARLRHRISTAELERRWKIVRQGMQARNLDFLIMQNSISDFCGYVKWFTDLPVMQGYPITIIFPREDEMTIISHGPRPPAEPNPAAWVVRGVKKRLSAPVMHSMFYSSTYDAELAVNELKPYKDCRIGWVGPGYIAASFYQYLTENLSSVTFEGASGLVDRVKVIKSAEEISLIREACKIQDTLFQYSLTCIRPGRKDYEVRADLVHKLLEMGGTGYNIGLGSAPVGSPPRPVPPHMGNRVIEKGDQVAMLLETNGPGGLWGEFSRTVCLGKAPQELLEHYELARQTQKVTLDLLKPGADPMDMWNANNEFLRSHGYPEERRIFAHGQGYDMMERPSLNPGETMKIQAGMNIAIHPEVKSVHSRGAVCENYLVLESGGPECLHQVPQKIFEI